MFYIQAKISRILYKIYDTRYTIYLFCIIMVFISGIFLDEDRWWVLLATGYFNFTNTGCISLKNMFATTCKNCFYKFVLISTHFVRSMLQSCFLLKEPNNILNILNLKIVQNGLLQFSLNIKEKQKYELFSKKFNKVACVKARSTCTNVQFSEVFMFAWTLCR